MLKYRDFTHRQIASAGKALRRRVRNVARPANRSIIFHAVAIRL
jgi:hypothetical protein